VYQDADVYLLDDPLSAVDSHVAKHIFRQVLGRDGLLKNKARLLVTHALHVLPQVDQILLLKGGCIAEKGNYDHLMSSKGDAFKLFDEYNSNEAESSRESTPVDSTEPVPIDDTQEDRTTSTDSAVIPTTPSKASISTADSTKVSTAASPTKGATESSGLITVENAGEGNVKGDVYLQYFRAITWRVTFGVLFVYVLSYAMQVGSNKWLDIWSSEQAAHDEAVDDNNPNPPKVRPLEVYLGVYAALGFGNCFGVLFATLFLAYGSVRASRVLHENMLHRIVRAPMKFFDTTPMGRIVK
jgi:ABC-type multidrug transport system fused ATPase/permease subunit